LAEKTLEEFTRAGSGRTNHDKALLYIVLRDEEGCSAEAAGFLHKTLVAIARDSARRPDTSPVELQDDFFGALQQFSPNEPILEEWLDARLSLLDKVDDTRGIVANLIARQTKGLDPLIEHVGKKLPEEDIVAICSQLVEEGLFERCAEIRGHA